MKPLERKRSLECIEMLRVIAAFGVMLSHVGYGYYYAKSFDAAIGIHLFFCISAFLMMLNSEKAEPGAMFVRRVIRLIPLYWIMNIATFAASYVVSGFGQANIPIDQLVKSLLFLPYVRDGMKDVDVVRPIVGPAWTMNYDFWFLVLFVISTKISRKMRGLIACVACLAVYIGGRFLPGDWAVARFMQREIWLYYIAGIGVYALWRRLRNAEKAPKRTASYLVLCAALLAVLYYTPAERHVWKILILSAAILFLTVFVFEKARVPAFVPWFGSVSYSFYLTHYYVVMILSVFFDFTEFTALTVLGTVLVIAASLVVAQISCYIVEQKFGGFLKKKLVRS